MTCQLNSSTLLFCCLGTRLDYGPSRLGSDTPDAIKATGQKKELKMMMSGVTSQYKSAGKLHGLNHSYC